MNARRLAALLEVFGVYVTGQYLVTLLVGAFHLPAENPLAHLRAQMTGAELLFATRDLFFLLLLQYGGWFLLIVPINWWHRRTGPAGYGLTRSGKSWMYLLGAGLATTALVGWPATAVDLLDRAYNLGPTAAWRQALFEMSWRRWEFWLFTAVLSWAFVAFMEELFFRGYCQRRLAEDWGDGPAILCTTCLFLLSHGPYLFLNSYNVALLGSLLVYSVAAGVIFAWTRSLVPSVLAHAIVNLPMTPGWQGLLLVACLLGTAFLWRRGAIFAVVKRVFAGASPLWCAVLAAIGAGYAVVSQVQQVAVYLGAILLGLAVALEGLRREQSDNIPQSVRRE